jgi:tetratricopeptide (TPR) repeat protein
MKLVYIFLLALFTTITYSQEVKKLIKEAEAKTEANDLQGALTLYNRIIALTPQDAEMYLNRANINFWLENYKEAMDDHNKTIELQPSSAKYFYERAFFFQNLYQFEYALLDCDKALELPIDDEKTLSRIYSIRANSKKFMGDYEGSHNDFQKALKHKPEAGTEIACLTGDGFCSCKVRSPG